MKKLSESVWSDIHKRSNGEQLRKEDTYKFNIDELKEIDLGPQVPFYWADIDLKANGDTEFNRDTVDEMLPQIKKTGWRLPYGPFELKSFIKSIIRYDCFTTEFKSYFYGIIRNEDTGASLKFDISNEFGESYWAEDDYRKTYPNERVASNTERSFYVGEEYFEGNKKMCLISTNNRERHQKAKIRLVKDK